MVIQMINGMPPYFRAKNDIAIKLILDNGKPEIANEENFSVQLQSFLSRCLIVDIKKRSSAKDLLQHGFLYDMAPRSAIADLVARFNTTIKNRKQ